jgi:hypothetical protein
VTYDRERTSVTIQQLQGAPHSREELQRLRWPRLLVAAMVHWAGRLSDVTEVHMTPAYKQEWFNEPADLGERTLEEYQAAMKTRYDWTAKRSGFEWNEDLERWVHPLTASDNAVGNVPA